jgi:hypothetical protein
MMSDLETACPGCLNIFTEVGWSSCLFEHSITNSKKLLKLISNHTPSFNLRIKVGGIVCTKGFSNRLWDHALVFTMLQSRPLSISSKFHVYSSFLTHIELPSLQAVHYASGSSCWKFKVMPTVGIWLAYSYVRPALNGPILRAFRFDVSTTAGLLPYTVWIRIDILSCRQYCKVGSRLPKALGRLGMVRSHGPWWWFGSTG